MPPLRPPLLVALLPLVSPLLARAEVRIAPAPDGRVGAWLVAGPFEDAKPGGHPEGHPEEGALRPEAGASLPLPGGAAGWALASTAEGPLELGAMLRRAGHIAYAGAVLHLKRAERLFLLFAPASPARVWVDGRRLRGGPADDVVTLDLAAGDHPIVMQLVRRDGEPALGVRLVDRRLRAPAGAYLALPGTTADDGRSLAQRMAKVTLDRGLRGAQYRPTLTTRYTQGAPLDVPRRVRARLRRADGASLFEVDAGDASVDAGDFLVTLPTLEGAALDRMEELGGVFEVSVAGHATAMAFAPKRFVRDVVTRADRIVTTLTATTPAPSWLGDGTLESIVHLRDRLVRFASDGDGDVDAQAAEARELDAALTQLAQGVDPYRKRTGPMRRAYRSPVDGDLSEFGVYVPSSFRPGTGRSYPLIVALHGLNGLPMAMLRHVFGHDDPQRSSEWEDRHLGELEPLEAFVVTPGGHGNTMYRGLGEDDVIRVLDWATGTYPIDATRITITGPSMGGTGTAAIAFHHPSRFAAAAPLCGYQSYFVRRDVQGRPMRPWERVMAEERSPALWAYNGERLPLWIVHGTLDYPVANSGALIERYEELGYPVRHDHPRLGHNVWQPTYEHLKGVRWLLEHRRDPSPRSVRFRTIQPRNAQSAWVRIEELTAPDAWGEVEARIVGPRLIEVRTVGVAALRLSPNAELTAARGAVTVRIDGQPLSFEARAAFVLRREGDRWAQGPTAHTAPVKAAEVTGPIRDAFHAPLMFVYGADDAAEAGVNEEVARGWARIRDGVTVKYPIVSDREFFVRGESIANERALFLVGNARSNRVVRELEPALPIRIEGSAVRIGNERFTGEQLGAAFIYPNPRRPDRYIVVVESTEPIGTWRSLSLPELLPDFVVYDAGVARARGQMLLGAGAHVRAGGVFGNNWSLPRTLRDPLAPPGRGAP